MTATRLSVSTSGSSLAGIYDVTNATYGATGNGSTDDTTAIQAAITAANATGGTVYFPPGIYKITSTLICNNNPGKALRLTGPGGWSHFGSANVAAVIRYTGVGTALQCFSVLAFELDHLKIEATNVLHTGDIVDVDGGPLAADCQLWEIHHCGISTATNNTRSNIRLSKAIIGSVHHCHMTGGQTPLRLGDPAGGYVVGVEIHNNTYNNGHDGHILVGTGDGEAITIRNETFEDMPTNGAIHGNNTQLYTPVISHCWFGDASAAGTWINGLTVTSSNFVGTIGPGNRMADPAGLSGQHFNLFGAWMVFGNSCEGGTIYQTDHGLALTDFGNCYNTSGAIFSVPSTRPTYRMSFSNVTPTSVKSYDGLPQRIAIGGRDFPGGALDPGPVDSSEQIVLGVTNNDTAVALGTKAGIYAGTNSLKLQSQSGTNGREVQLVAGTSPTAQVRASGTGLGFYATAPVAQAARAGQLTDSTGGTVTSTLAAGIADAVAKNAIASLAAKVNALETIIHNLGLSA